MFVIHLTSENNINLMKIFALKIAVADGEKPENHSFIVKAETYGRAETMAYEIATEFGWKLFQLESVIKKQINEIHKSVFGVCTMWLVDYEYGLEVKPEKANILYAGKNVNEISNIATSHLSEFCDSLFIKGIKHMDFEEYLDDSENTEKTIGEQFIDDLQGNFRGQKVNVTMISSSGEEEEFEL
jgi:hypothetical protein